MPFEKGQPKPPTSGPRKGVIPRTKQGRRSAADILAALGVDPVTANALISLGDVPCGVCHGKGKTKYQPKTRTLDDGAKYQVAEDPDGSERVCQSCWGSGKERISPELKFKANDMLAKYVHPTLKQMELSGPNGGPMSMSLADVVRARREQDAQEKQDA